MNQVGGATCPDCEGSGEGVRFQGGAANKWYTIPCPPHALEARIDRAPDWVNLAVHHKRWPEAVQAYLLVKTIERYTVIPCPTCGGTGWAIRLIRTGEVKET